MTYSLAGDTIIHAIFNVSQKFILTLGKGNELRIVAFFVLVGGVCCGVGWVVMGVWLISFFLTLFKICVRIDTWNSIPLLLLVRAYKMPYEHRKERKK